MWLKFKNPACSCCWKKLRKNTGKQVRLRFLVLPRCSSLFLAFVTPVSSLLSASAAPCWSFVVSTPSSTIYVPSSSNILQNTRANVRACVYVYTKWSSGVVLPHSGGWPLLCDLIWLLFCCLPASTRLVDHCHPQDFWIGCNCCPSNQSGGVKCFMLGLSAPKTQNWYRPKACCFLFDPGFLFFKHQEHGSHR